MLLGELRDCNQVLFYRLLSEHLSELLAIIYTPTVGAAIHSYSHEYRRPHRVYPSVERPGAVERALPATGLRVEDVDPIVVIIPFAAEGEGK